MSVVDIVPAHEPPLLDEVRALVHEYVAWLGIDLSFQGFAEEMAGLPGAYAPPRGRVLLARAGGAAAGCVALRPLDEPGACEMKRMWVRPAFRGHGVGRALAERVVAEARAVGYRCMRLDTLASMAEANALYERLGFRDIPAYRFNPHPQARYLELDLTGA